MSFTRLRYHITFATKNREPVIQEEHQPTVHQKLRDACTDQDGRLFEIGGVPDHVHLLAGIPATCAVSSFVGELKRRSTLEIRKTLDSLGDFSWQSQYSAFTVSDWDMRRISYYVRNQRERHSEDDLWEGFEPD